jgi:hypothetical protein
MDDVQDKKARKSVEMVARFTGPRSNYSFEEEKTWCSDEVDIETSL